MDEKMKRVPLSEEEVEMVAGGNVLYVCTSTEHYCYGSHNPDVKYEFNSRKKMLAFIEKNYDYYGEAGIFQALIDEGICTPMN